MSKRLDGKVCVITGAAGGMGREAVLLFCSEGAKVCVADVDGAAAERTAAEAGDAFAMQVDVANEESVQSMYAETAKRFGGIDVLYNNAGVSPADDASILDTELDAWERVQAVNTRGVFLCCKHGIPLPARARRRFGDQRRVVRRPGGRSDLADLLHGVEGRGAVAQSRARRAVRAARRSRERAVPGTGRDAVAASDLRGRSAAFERRRIHLPIGRLAKPREIVNAALFLASDESSYVNGAAFVVDGGITAAYVTPE
jgi:NAD(P)-dependent dehydrogenase (short-subunit alcohol dehydrogenase family)